MVEGTHFRRILPLLETALTLCFGGWGLWLRHSILSSPFLDTTLWHSTAAFHVWPWPFKFAVILNMPVFLAALLLFWPIEAFLPAEPEWASYLAVLALVPLLWYRIGAWLDRARSTDTNRNLRREHWILLVAFTIVCAAASFIPSKVGGYTNFLLFGPAIWVAAAATMKVIVRSRKRRSGAS